MIDAIFIIGKPGSGKTEMVHFQTSLLTASGFEPDTLSDRLWLEDAVLLDTREGFVEAESGARVGPHSVLLADGAPGHRKIHVLDGSLLNQVHDSMVEYVTHERAPGSIVVAEYAIGPDIKFGHMLAMAQEYPIGRINSSHAKEPLLQNAHWLVDRLTRFKVMDRALVIDVEAPMSARAAREAVRPDKMADETFRAYFPDGGEIEKNDASLLGNHYRRLDNGHDDFRRFAREAHDIYHKFIFPQIRTEGFPPGHFR